jgi:serine/threonine-protein kinase
MDASKFNRGFRHPSTRVWLAVVGLTGVLLLGARWRPGASSLQEATKMQVVEGADVRTGGTVAVGDSALTAPMAPFRAPFAWSAIAVELPPKPLPEQLRPDATGRCPHRSEVAINGGCWKKLAVDLKDCEEVDYVYKGGCYIPAFPPPRPGMSNPMGIASNP